MVPKPTVALIPGVGLEGDRYAGNIGTYSALPEPGRQLTMISADSVEAALSEEQKLQLDSSVGRLRRNVVLRGLSGEDLCNAIGSVVQFGSDNNVAPLVFVHRNCVPW
jgi:MOSC domain-containing protein YiiM